MSQITAKQVASFLINYAKSHGNWITNLQIQKLVYYAQAWHLTLFDQPLFDEPIEAWVHGPVVLSVYNKYRMFGWNPITTMPKKSEITPKVEKFLKEIYGVFGSYTAFDLERMTHNEFPWQNARKGLPIDAPSRNIISHQDMKSFYSTLLKNK